MNLSSLPLRSGVECLSQMPLLFDGLRWLLESGHRAHYRLLANQFHRPPRRVLDCGCGTGIFARAFPASAYVGIDVCSRYIARARSRHPNYCFYQMDALNLSFAAESFDAVIVSGVLHHLHNSDARRMLGEISRVLNPNGTLLVWEDVPTRQSLNWIGQAVHALDIGCHIRTCRGYEELLHESCFSIAESYPLRSGFMDYSVFRCHKSPSSTLVASPTTGSPYCVPPISSDFLGSATGSLN